MLVTLPNNFKKTAPNPPPGDSLAGSQHHVSFGYGFFKVHLLFSHDAVIFWLLLKAEA